MSAYLRNTAATYRFSPLLKMLILGCQLANCPKERDENWELEKNWKESRERVQSNFSVKLSQSASPPLFIERIPSFYLICLRREQLH
jgi:hypothetical protein